MANPTSTPNPRMTASQLMGGTSQPAGLLSGASGQQPTKEVNATYLCRVGQELVHEVVNKAMEIFMLLKSTQLPNGVSNNPNYQECKSKLEEWINQITVNFRHLLIIQQKVTENTAHLEDKPPESLLPIEKDGEIQGETPKMSESVRFAQEEHKEVVAQLRSRNKELKEVIDKLRLTIWEINTMISTRKTLPSGASFM